MIGKSDLVILTISATLLVTGIYRWQSNLSPSSARQSVAQDNRSDKPRAGNTDSLAAKPATTPDNVNAAPAVAVETPVQGNFGDTAQQGSASATTTDPSPPGNADLAAVSTTANAGDNSLYGTYEVEPGDSLSRIAINYGTTVESLRSINNINGSQINIGQIIRYPLPAN